MFIVEKAMLNAWLRNLLALTAGLLPVLALSQTFENAEKQVLAIFGTGGVATWEQNFNSVFLNQLGAKSGVYIDPEFLSLANANAREQEIVAQSLQLKYQSRNFDLVVAVLPEANTFVADWKQLFAPSADVIQVLPDPSNLKPFSNQERSAAIYSSAGISVRKTVELIPAILPDLDKAYVVSGVGPSDSFYLELFKRSVSQLDLGFEIEYLTGLTPQELLVELAVANEKSAVLMTTYSLDSTGVVHRTLQVTEFLSNEITIPVFGFIDTIPAYGSIGGNVAITENYAYKAAELAEAALAGEFPEQTVSADTKYIFNGALLDRFGIDRGLLPQGSEIVFENATLWREYYVEVIFVSAVVALLLIIVGFLLNAIRMRKIAELELLKSHKRDALGSLAGGIAHDFNNILMSITANTELASLDVTQPGTKDRLASILAATSRAKNLVRQILMFNHSSVSGQFLTVDLSSHLEECIDQLRVMFGANHTIGYRTPGKPLLIQADPTQLHQIVMNVCINAQYAMPNGGAIKISAEELSLSSSRLLLDSKVPAGDYVKLEISDSGTGISAEHLGQIFEPFFTTKPTGEGTGLGLALVADIVQRHEAYIDVQSRLGHGTTISFYFPASPLSSVAGGDLSSKAGLRKGSGETVLLVEDDGMVSGANKQLLERLNYSVIAFTDPNAALLYFSESHPTIDIVLSDFDMPKLDGIQLLEKIRGIDPSMPAILYTGYLEELDRKRVASYQVLQKPIEAAELSTALYMTLKKEE